MILKLTAPFDDGKGGLEMGEVLVDVLKRQPIAREGGEGRTILMDEDGEEFVINMSLGAFHEAYEAALQSENLGI